jgi:hypothetical protein
MTVPKKRRKVAKRDPRWKALLKKAGRVVTIVIHDPEVRRSGKQFAAKIAVRVLIAAGASVQLVELVQRFT